MKFAVCLSGYPKFIDKSLQSIDKIKNYGDVKIFIHTWNISDVEKFRSTCWNPNLNKDAVSLINDLFNPESILIENFENNKYYLESIFNSHAFTKFARRDIGPISMYYSIFRSNKLKIEYEQKNKMNFDCCVRMRFDSDIKDDFNIKNYDLNLLNIPQGKDWGGINDQFAFGNSGDMDKYSNVIYGIVGDIYHPETILMNHLHANKINVSRINLKVEINNE